MEYNIKLHIKHKLKHKNFRDYNIETLEQDVAILHTYMVIYAHMNLMMSWTIS